MYELQNAYYDLMFGRENEKEKFWIKRLRNILESDIHERPLGCKIPETHIKIGNVHMHSFYEAQILFSHSHWVQRFSVWLNEQIGKLGDIKAINVIGYETYIEPVLFSMKSTNEHVDIRYGIYEEPKLIQGLDNPTEERIRYIERLHSNAPCIYICGISSTLKTFKRMIEFSNLPSRACFSLIQVFPEMVESAENDEEKEKIKANNERLNKVVRLANDNVAVSSDNELEAKFLVSVKCKWEMAETCKLCFPDNPLEERPIIETSETSVVPIQMIQPVYRSPIRKYKQNDCPKIDFFEKDEKGNYLLKDYLYYGHIDRMDYHYKYYIRTGSLVKDILDFDDPCYVRMREQLIAFCNYIKEKEEVESDKIHTIDIIVSPSHFSDEVFPNVINQHVFKGKAHTISFDMNKEHRLSFLAKYSNIAYFLEQAKDTKCKIRFYFVEDQLISSKSYSRAKSLITTLMEKYKKEKTNESGDSEVDMEIFFSVIVLLSRNSNDSKLDYVQDIDRYYSLIDISVPSIRNFADSCPVCKLRHNAEEYSKKSTLSVNSLHWAGKHSYYGAVTVEKAKKIKDELKIKKPSFIERNMRRFECENALWNEIKKKDCDDISYVSVISSVIQEYAKDEKVIKVDDGKVKVIKARVIDAEYIISIVKAISLPSLFYIEYEKVAALGFVLETINQYEKELIKKSEIYLGTYNAIIEFKSNQEKYELLIVLINCLAEMNSTYLLSIEHIRKLYDAVEVIDDELLSLVQSKQKQYREGFFASVLYAFKRSVCGIGGKAKISVFDKQISDCLGNVGEANSIEQLFRLLFLENTDESYEIDVGNLNNSNRSTYNDLLSRYEIMYEKMRGSFLDAKKADKKIPLDIELKNVFFVYLNKKIPFRFLYDENEASLYTDDVLKSDISSLNNPDTGGILFSNNVCLVRMKLDAPEEGASKEDFSYPKIYERESSADIYLVMLFSDDSIKAIRGIREILKYRHSIYRILRNDYKTGNIHASIQAKKGGEILKSDKSITHNTDRDIKALADQAIYLIDVFDMKKEYSFESACIAVGTYMNRCISYANTASIVEDYFTESPDNDYNESSYHQRFVNTLQSAQHWDKGKEFFKEYLNDLQQGEESRYLRLNGNGYPGRINFKIEGENPVEILEKVDFIPHFVTPATHDTKYAMLSYIGIFDTLLLNAIKHGPPRVEKPKDDSYYFTEGEDGNCSFEKNEIIDIVCKTKVRTSKENKLLNYDITLCNNTNESRVNTGITLKFFKNLSVNKAEHFSVIPNPDEDDRSNIEDGFKTCIQVNVCSTWREKKTKEEDKDGA